MSNQNFSQKPIYSQSFSRSGNNRPDRRDGQRNNSDRRDNNQYESNFQNSYDQSEGDEVVIQVNKRKLGCIIGKQGANIKKLENDSGAKIQIPKDRNAENVDVTIKGSADARSAACEMIQNCISDDNRRRDDYNQSRSGGFQQRSGGFDNQRSGGFDNQQRSGGFDSQQQSDSFDNQQWSSSDNKQGSDSFGNQSSDAWGNQSSDAWGNQSSDGGWNNQSRSDGFDNRRQNDRKNQYESRNQNDDRSNQYDDRRNNDRRNQRNDRRDFNRNNNSGQDYNRSSNYSSNRFRDDSQGNSQYHPNQNYGAGAQSDFEPIDWEKLYQESEKQAAAKLAALPPIVKNLYVEDPEVANLSPKEVARFRASNMDIKVERVFGDEKERAKPILNPVMTFEHAFKPYPDILETIYKQEFKNPSPIQSQAWPIILSGEDMIGIAQTGTGKTLAFLLPALIHIESQTVPRNERVGPTVLILSPTRELALQIEKEINKYSYRGIKCVCVYGGGDRNSQSRILSQRPEIVVATPGRLEDFITTDQIALESVTYVVLDEADKMLEMGFECQIRRILLKVRGDRQSIMTSATWPNGVRRLVSQYSNNPVQVVVGSLDLAAVHSVSQKIELIDDEQKRERLTEFLAGMEPDDKVIVFCSKKSVTDDIASDLMLQGVKCQSIHGDREQCDREQALHDLKTGEVHILIATDVAARGIDIADITHIFNYDFPRNIEEYVHRIGRTGRAGKSGESISLFTRRDWANAADLIKILEEAQQGVPEELRSMAERFEKKQKEGNFSRGGRGGGGRGGGRGRPRY